MTPRQLLLHAEAYNQRLEYEQECKRQEIYTTALLISNFVWAKKKKPTYEQIFQKKKEQMTDEQMFRQVLALNAKFGGIDKRGENNGRS